MMTPALMCLPAPSPTARGCAARCIGDIGQAVDVSALNGRALNVLYGQLQERAPAIVDEARAECPNDAYAVCERALQLFEARTGAPFKVGAQS